MSQAQKLQLHVVLEGLAVDEFHNGAARGADEQAAKIALTHVLYRESVIAHPTGPDPLVRNREIVAACDVLIAAPSEDKEQIRSGTWATVRYERAAMIPVVMLSRGGRGVTRGSQV